MKWIISLTFTLLTAFSFGLCTAHAAPAAKPNPPSSADKPRRPSIIFILTDDQGYGDLERHGHPLLKTPHTNRLYDESVRFDNFYVSPSCSPTRAALLTGMHEFRNGVTHTRDPREHLWKEAVLLPQLLKTAGYRTGHIGKWHLGWDPGYHPYDRGFDFALTGAEHFDPEVTINKHRREQRKGYREDIYFDEAMSFIDETGEQPFFLYLATYSPHTPLIAPEEFIAPFRGKVTDEEAAYLGMIANIDYNVGRLLAFLEERKLDENTIVIFMNDNGVTKGLDVFNADMRGPKCTIWEGGSRAMSFWRWPGKWKPRKVDNLTAHLDVLPTLCELAKVDVPADLQKELEGFSLIPLLEAEDSISWHDDRMLFQHVARWPSGMAPQHKYAMAGVRQGDYLLVRSRPCDDPECTPKVLGNQCHTLRMVEKGSVAANYTKNNAQFHWGVSPPEQWVLYDTKKDPGCSNDLAADNPDLVQKLVAAYNQWWDAVYPVMVERGGENELNALKKTPVAKKVAPPVKAPVADATSAGLGAQGAVHFKRLDEDGNGQVSREEYVGVFSRTFPDKDTNNDGELSDGEFGFPVALKVADTDQDRKLTPAEHQNFYARQFENMDRDQSGSLTPAELEY